MYGAVTAPNRFKTRLMAGFIIYAVVCYVLLPVRDPDVRIQPARSHG